MMNMTAFCYDEPGGIMDKVAKAIFEDAGGRSIGAGTMLVGDRAGERDIQYHVPDDKADHVKGVLEKAGFRVKMQPVASP